ncbi:OmpA family protein [Tardiphaga sp. OK246]|jgi:outer membrane protein OmpA-like peptidoglycan-associated protein|nr:OmpA family protein [Tardiphaga sp. OK246]
MRRAHTVYKCRKGLDVGWAALLALMLSICAPADQTAKAVGTEADIIRSLQSKRILRCPTSSGCANATTANSRATTIRFSNGSGRLDGHARKRIRRFLVDFRNEMPANSLINVDGYADAIGSVSYNVALSRRRARSVREALIRHNIASRFIKITGNGIRAPDSKNASADDRVVVISAKRLER